MPAPAMAGDFIDHMSDLLAPLGTLRGRRMFGGYGLYCDGLFFALIANDVLYLKADDRNRPAFEAAGQRPFKPFDDKPSTLSYYPVPEEDFEDGDALLTWARGALDAALRAKATAKPPRRKART
jgi:DNA transformation protein